MADRYRIQPEGFAAHMRPAKSVDMVFAEEHDAEIATLKAENERLKLENTKLIGEAVRAKKDTIAAERALAERPRGVKVAELVDGLLDLRDLIMRGKRCVTDTGPAVKPVIELASVHILDAAASELEYMEAQLAERAGGVKAERDGMHRRAQLAEALYQSVVSTLKMWREVLGPGRRHDDFALFSFALADMEKAKARIEARLSTLTTEPAAPEGFCYRDENGQVQYQQMAPEGRQEAVAAPKARRLAEMAMDFLHHDADQETYDRHVEALTKKFARLTRGPADPPTRPSEQAVTEAMVERFIGVYETECRHRYDRDAISAGLKAAMEAGRRD